MVSFLVYNLLLVFVCTILAFKTRHLPDNFNESHFIVMSVTGTLILWGCFIIVYTLSPQKSTRSLFMVIALFCNHSLALIFLFFPRIYAVLFSKSGMARKKQMVIRIRSNRVVDYELQERKSNLTTFLPSQSGHLANSVWTHDISQMTPRSRVHIPATLTTEA